MIQLLSEPVEVQLFVRTPNYRYGQVSTIFCSQFMPKGWHERLRGSALVDSILDRIIPSAYTMRIDGDVSMRQRKRIIKG